MFKRTFATLAAFALCAPAAFAAPSSSAKPDLRPDRRRCRRPHGLARLKCYVDMTPGCTPVTQEAEALFEAKAGNRKLLGPYKAEVEQNLANTQRYADGIRKLYVKHKIEGAGPALDALQKQLDRNSIEPDYRGLRRLHLQGLRVDADRARRAARTRIAVLGHGQARRVAGAFCAPRARSSIRC